MRFEIKGGGFFAILLGLVDSLGRGVYSLGCWRATTSGGRAVGDGGGRDELLDSVGAAGAASAVAGRPRVCPRRPPRSRRTTIRPPLIPKIPKPSPPPDPGHAVMPTVG